MGLQDKLKKKTSTTTTIREEKQDAPPAGATILNQQVRTETEEIENGWLVTKHFSGEYAEKGSTDKYGRYFSYDKKWYSQEDPLTITVNDEALADAFKD